jgi:hypothetical protein
MTSPQLLFDDYKGPGSYCVRTNNRQQKGTMLQWKQWQEEICKVLSFQVMSESREKMMLLAARAPFNLDTTF